MSITDQPARDGLEREANLVRSRLATTLEALDHRRHDLMDVKVQLKKYARPLMIAGGSVVLLLAAGVGFGIYRFATRADRRRQQRIKMLPRAWAHPERIGTVRNKPPIVVEVGRKLLVGALTLIGMAVMRRAIQHPAAQRLLAGREVRTAVLPSP